MFISYEMLRNNSQKVVDQKKDWFLSVYSLKTGLDSEVTVKNQVRLLRSYAMMKTEQLKDEGFSLL